MKKLTALVLTFMFLFASLSAKAASLDFLSQLYTNYTGDYTFKLTFDNPKEIVSLFKEMEFPEQIGMFVDINSLLEGLLSQNGTMTVKGDIGKDYKKADVSIECSSSNNITINKNLDIGIKGKTGIWLSIDITDIQKPKYNMICSYPFFNKYLKLDLFELITDEDEKEAFTNMLANIFCEEFFNDISVLYAGLTTKYADIKQSQNKVTISYNNEAFSALLNEFMKKLSDIQKELLPEYGDDVFSPLEKLAELSFLGKDGISTVYNLKNGVITSYETKCDISIDIKSIYETLTGESWEYVNCGSLDFTLDMSGNISKINSTKVDFPVLNDENSFTLSDFFPDNVYYTNGIYGISDYIFESTDTLPIIDDEICLPLRQVIESAYRDDVSIDYNEGTITISGNDNLITIELNSGKVYISGSEIDSGAIFLENGKTYASQRFFQNAFGMELLSAQYDLIEKTYYFSCEY